MIKLFEILKRNSSNKESSNDEKSETRTLSTSYGILLVFLFLIVGIFALSFLKIFNVSLLGDSGTNCVRLQGNNYDPVTISSWILGIVSIVISGSMLVKEIHANKVSTLQAQINKKQKIIVKLGEDWQILYQTGQDLGVEKTLFDQARRKVADEKGITNLLAPSDVQKYINHNCGINNN